CCVFCGCFVCLGFVLGFVVVGFCVGFGGVWFVLCFWVCFCWGLGVLLVFVLVVGWVVGLGLGVLGFGVVCVVGLCWGGWGWWWVLF
ncbi:hypothetical protein, partial [Pseudomonas syringae group genomosp. 7]|uniref:hypothetical protein n=1 Tax=Pseudomonas syringae group genomosp. 7 TaxID=251699 RepID=UPI00376FFC45